eukprot:TRINITY_DN21067_c0_g2_i4.p1 TRINITY_DN21067_c0_g2~~TRINITY_DN21067_c0_g2_i4.p1  ORF type:complete len:139 (+),score=19.84 TRINITY_DN21067_c0_g2_i4:125-541(+)
MLQIYNCVPSDDGKYVVHQEASVVCGSSAWKQFVYFDVVVLSIYLFIFPGMLYVLYNFNIEQFKIIISPLVRSYRPGKEWFEIAKQVFHLVCVLIRDTLNVSGTSKMMLLEIALLVFLWVQVHSRPYPENRPLNLSLL